MQCFLIFIKRENREEIRKKSAMNCYFDDELFDPENIEHWLLLASFIGFGIYSFWLVNKEEKRGNRPTHRYNRRTGEIEPYED
jgi:hypothetical protein